MSITAALDYLRTIQLPGVTNVTRQYVHTFAWNYVQSKYADPNSAQHKILSNSLAMGATMGTSRQKSMRSVLFLLNHAIADAAQRSAELAWNRAAEAKNIGAGEVEEELARTMLKARAVSDQRAGRDATARDVLTNIFRHNPYGFLRENRFFIGGTSRNDAAQGDRNVLGFYFCYDPGQDRWEIKPQLVRTALQEPVPPGAFGFDAVSVPAVLWAAVPNRAHYPPPPAADPDHGSFADIAGTRLDRADFMVTTQFTGCSFCWNTVAGATFAAHISPSDVAAGGHTSMDATRLARQLAGLEAANVTPGDFANARGPGFRVYGKGSGNGGKPGGYPNIDFARRPGDNALSWMCIIGFRNGGPWNLYSQTIQHGEILRVERIN